MGHPIPAIRLFQNLTLKIQGQGHGWGESSKSQSGCNILSTHIPFVPCQSALPFLRYSIFKIWPWKSKVKVMSERKVESHNMGPTFYRLTSLSSHVNRPSHSWDTTFSKFDLESKVNAMVEVKVQSNKAYRLTSLSFHVKTLPFLRYSIFKIFQGQGHGWGVNWKSNMGPIFYRLIFNSMSIGHPIPEIWKIWALKI